MVDRWAGAHLDCDTELVGDDVRERGLAEPRRPAQQNVFDRLIAPPRRLEEDAQVVADLLLTHVLGEEARAECEVELLIVRPRVQDFVLGHLRPSALSAVASAS